MTELVLVAHNIRSTHNVGSLLRTADGLGVHRVYLTGYTPYPPLKLDERPPYQAAKTGRQINKTALGAENSVAWQHRQDIMILLDELEENGFMVAALEQTPGALSLPSFRPPPKIALVVGREVEGVEPEVLQACGMIVEIPMLGKKESFNVVQAAAMALYHCRFGNF